MSNKSRIVGEKQFLRERVEYVRGVTYKAAIDLHQELDADSFVLLRANNIQGGDIVFEDVQYVDKSKVKAKQLLRKGDILVCASSGSKGLVGKAALVKKDMPVTFGAFCCVIRSKYGESQLLGHYFQSRHYRNAIEKACSGSNINNLKAANFSSLIVPRYNADDMHAIEGELDVIVEQQREAREQLKQLDQLVKSRFVEMFGDPCDLSGQGNRARIDSFCELRIGPFGSSLHRDDYIDGGHELINPSHIVNGKLCPDSTLSIDDAKFESMGQYHLHLGDIVLGRRGEIGRCAVVDREGLICGTGSMILRPGAECRSDYLQRVISFPSFSRALEGDAVGVTMKNLNAKIVGSAEVSLPPMELQQKFADFATQVDKTRAIAQQQIEKLQLLYDSLAQDYFGD